MLSHLVFAVAGCLVTNALAYAPIQWVKSPWNGFVITPEGLSREFRGTSPSQKLTLSGQTNKISFGSLPHFAIRRDQSIAFNDLGCLEASGDNSGDLVRLNHCTGGSSQKWTWVPSEQRRMMIQLQDTSKCLQAVDDAGALKEAQIQLRECEAGVSDAWRFEEPLPLATEKRNVAITTSFRYVLSSLFLLVVFAAIVLAGGLRHWSDKRRVIAADSAFLNDEVGGVSLSAPLTQISHREATPRSSQRTSSIVMGEPPPFVPRRLYKDWVAGGVDANGAQDVNSDAVELPRGALVEKNLDTLVYKHSPAQRFEMMTVEEFTLDTLVFDPTRAQTQHHLLENLNVSPSAIIEEPLDAHGSFNDGVWFVTDDETVGLVLKLVPHQRQPEWPSNRQTDTEKYVALQKMCPNIGADWSFSVPVKILQLKSVSGHRCGDLIVMRRALGWQITQHLFYKFPSVVGQAELLLIFKKFGMFMATLHNFFMVDDQAMQHGDCQPSNVFYDALTDKFTLIDCADFGFGPYLAEGGENDVEHFIDGLKTLTPFYTSAFIKDCETQFRTGYEDEGSQRR